MLRDERKGCAMKKTTTIDITALLGNISEVQKELLQFHADWGMLNQSLVELIRKYPDQWAAAYKGEIYVAQTQEDLIKKLGENAKHAAFAFLSSKPINLILPHQ